MPVSVGASVMVMAVILMACADSNSDVRNRDTLTVSWPSGAAANVRKNWHPLLFFFSHLEFHYFHPLDGAPYPNLFFRPSA